MSIVFDRAVEFYDQTRAVPPEVESLAIEALLRETHLTRGARILEIGVGTGRIAIPLAKQMEKVFGVDLSYAMMQVLQRKIAGTSVKIQLAQADVVRLPFAGSFFDAVYAVHVLHLVAGWQRAIAETRRVLKPGGHLLVSWHRRMPDSTNVLLRRELHRLVGEHGFSTKRPGAQSEEEIRAELELWGGGLQVVEVAEWSEPSTPAEVLDELDRQIYSETWMIPRSVMDEVMPRLRAWASEQFGPLEREFIAPYNFRWLIARKPE